LYNAYRKRRAEEFRSGLCVKQGVTCRSIRELRKQAGSFLDLCYNSSLAAEVTLQPLRRFDMSAAILLSDILVVPHALGVDVRFEESKGPIVEKILSEKRISEFTKQQFLTHL